MKKLLAQLVAKYGVGSDTILLSWILQHPAQVIPIAGTVNVARIQALMKATELPLEKRIGLQFGVEAWVKMYLNYKRKK